MLQGNSRYLHPNPISYLWSIHFFTPFSP
jgi:hypothetical protein